MFFDPLINRAAESIVNYPEALDYLVANRKLLPEELKKYRIGFTAHPFLPKIESSEWEDFMKESRKLFFIQKKILFPLENAAGRVNGMITRSMDPETNRRYSQFLLPEAKQIGAFFGLPQAIPHIIKTGIVYVTEGAIDCMTLARVFPNTVSTLTSFVNEEQMWTLKMLADSIVLVFDPDEPGRKGVEIVLNKYGSKGIFSREFGHGDPNSCLQKLGTQRFKQLAEKELSGFLNFKKG